MCVWKERRESLKIERQEFVGRQTDTNLINLTNVYLFHCLVFGNLSQHTTISPSYHQHLVRLGGGRGEGEEEGRKGEVVKERKKGGVRQLIENEASERNKKNCATVPMWLHVYHSLI